MSEVHYRLEQLDLNTHTIITIGTFDGVHLGHKKILEQLLIKKKNTDFKTLVFTFEPHPRKILFPNQHDLKLITETHEKVSLLQNIGIDHIVVFPFDKAFSEIPSEDYISEILVKKLKAKVIIVGYDHRYGKNREGGLEMLKKFSTQYGFEVIEIAAEDINSINISSTQIRKAIESGNIEQANLFLGYPFFITGKVVEGKKLGRNIGFPTANIELKNGDKITPKTGVYAVKVIFKNKIYNAMLNVGYNPTVSTNENKLKIEVHLFDFNQQIYDQELRINFMFRLRDEYKFNGINELKEQLKLDQQQALKLLK